MLIFVEDLNAKKGRNKIGKEKQMFQNGKLFTDFCAFSEHTMRGTIFPH